MTSTEVSAIGEDDAALAANSSRSCWKLDVGGCYESAADIAAPIVTTDPFGIVVDHWRAAQMMVQLLGRTRQGGTDGVQLQTLPARKSLKKPRTPR